jgi:hypothetical protein
LAQAAGVAVILAVVVELVDYAQLLRQLAVADHLNQLCH